MGGKSKTLKELSLYTLTDREALETPVYGWQNMMDKLREKQVIIPDSYIGILRILISFGGLLQMYQVPMSGRVLQAE